MARKESKKRHTTTPPTTKATTKKPTASVNKPTEAKTPSVAETITKLSATPAVAETVTVPPTPTVDLDALRRLTAELRNADADVAREAAVGLAGYQHEDAVDALVDVLTNTDGYYHSVVRSAAAASLGQIGDRRAIDALLSAVRDPMAEASAEAVRALADLGDDHAVESLVNVVRNVDGFYLPVVRLAAVHALARFNTEAAREQLQYVAQDNYEDPVIRNAASRA
jgi:HEAT repeat protein